MITLQKAVSDMTREEIRLLQERILAEREELREIRDNAKWLRISQNVAMPDDEWQELNRNIKGCNNILREITHQLERIRVMEEEAIRGFRRNRDGHQRDHRYL